MMKRRMYLIIFICLLCGFIGFAILHDTYSISEVYIDNFISDNIVKLNSILEDKIDTSNPFYIVEIVDENGNVPAYEYYGDDMIPSRAINDLKGYDNKVFLGIGDYDKNTGPVKIIYYDTITGKIETSGTIPDEEVQFFEIIDDKLYTTGADPKDTWGYGSYYTYDTVNNSWNQHLFNNGWIHVYNIKKYKDRIFMFGSVTVESGRSPVQVSYDNGVTFEDVKLMYSFDGSPREEVPSDGSIRCYGMGYLDDYLYIQLGTPSELSKYAGIYDYDMENNEFNYIAGLPYRTDTYILSSAINFNYTHFRNLTFNGRLLFLSGNYLMQIKRNTDLSSPFRVSVGSKKIDSYGVQDAIYNDDTLYLLLYRFNEDRTFDCRILKTKDYKTFDTVYDFSLNSVPFAIEYYNNKLYIGTGYDGSYIDINETGSLYELDLDILKKNLTLDKENEIINVTTDGSTYPVNYEVTSDKTVFETNLSFNKDMSEKEWNLEYLKLKHLNLLYVLADNHFDVDYDYSTAYFDDILNSNISFDTSGYSNGIDFAKDVFDEELNIVDKRFSIRSENVSVSDDEYTVSITFAVNNIDDSITSSKYKVNDKLNYIYVGTDNDSYVIKNNINVDELLDTTVDLDNNKLIISRNNSELSSLDILSIKFNDLITTNNYVIISEKITYDNFINNITLSEGLNVKLFNRNNEVTNGYIEDDMIVKVYYNDEVIDEYSIIDNIDYYLEFDDNLEVDDGNKLFTNIKSGASIENINNMIYTNGSVSIYDKDNNLLTDYSGRIGTGYRFNIKLSNEVLDYIVSVKGDVNGDGIVNVNDVIKIAKHILKTEYITGNEYIEASDVIDDDDININDVIKIAKHIINKEEL